MQPEEEFRKRFVHGRHLSTSILQQNERRRLPWPVASVLSQAQEKLHLDVHTSLGWGRWTDRSTETKSLKDSEQRDKVARQLPEGPGRVSPEGPAPPGPDSVPPETALQGEKETHRTASNAPR